MVCFVLGAEEINWFSDLAGYELRSISSLNSQEEVNFHNIEGFGFKLLERNMSYLMITYGLVVPALFRIIGPLNRWSTKSQLPIPGALSLFFFVYGAVFRSDLAFYYIAKPEEVSELFLALGFLTTAIELSTNRNHLLLLRNSAIFCLLLSLLMTHFGPQYETATNKAWREWMLGELIYDSEAFTPAARLLTKRIQTYRRNNLVYGTSVSSEIISFEMRKPLYGLANRAPENLLQQLALDAFYARINQHHLLTLNGDHKHANQQLNKARTIFEKELKAHPETQEYKIAQLLLYAADGDLKSAKRTLQEELSYLNVTYHHAFMKHIERSLSGAQKD
jgi:hypothetical protein